MTLYGSGGVDKQVVPEEEINSNIKSMGYVLVTPRRVYPSFYRLSDGTILKVIVNLNHLIPDMQNPDSVGVNSTNITSTYVPKKRDGQKCLGLMLQRR